ncbi:flagellar biosynthesis protein FlhF [Chengkuizengella sediminis]|uniref:flagellar biosynthesis protein FlhF n=1 Tax=Chengkuizengella sediminis TaxID=1885917 RepID=UPI00138A3D86|nr:flagellar biosynthesis protein FlhF [Chengkuizengella sediminis]NDI33372.1 flagellar biosynthesis protein FlhF [Chengkuizengella sediminis]
MRVKRYVVESMPTALQKIKSELGQNAVILNTKEFKQGGFLGLYRKKRIEVIAASETNKEEKVVKENKLQVLNSSLSTITKDESTSASDSDVLDEVKKLKEFILKFHTNEENSKIPNHLKDLQLRLNEHEFEAQLIDNIIQHIIEQHDEELSKLSESKTNQIAREHLIELLSYHNIQGISPQTKIAYFVGPTGVGKTTTIAKLAADQVLKYNRKIALITSDTYRIAAIDQLKTYANILDVPLHIVNSPKDFEIVIEKLQDVDVILMDTAGRNFRNEMNVSELKSLLKTEEQSETYLVLSLTTKYRDMKTITHNFMKFGIDKVLFTKMDETESLGNIFNLVSEFSLKPSYITYGQNVPDDVSVLKYDEVIDRIMGDP